MHHCFHAVGDDLTAHQRRTHSFVTHRNTIAHRDGAELECNSTSFTYASLGELRKFAQGHVARCDFIPR